MNLTGRSGELTAIGPDGQNQVIAEYMKPVMFTTLGCDRASFGTAIK